MKAWLRSKWGSAIRCAIGMHGACDGSALQYKETPFLVECACRCHE